MVMRLTELRHINLIWIATRFSYTIARTRTSLIHPSCVQHLSSALLPQAAEPLDRRHPLRDSDQYFLYPAF